MVETAAPARSEEINQNVMVRDARKRILRHGSSAFATLLGYILIAIIFGIPILWPFFNSFRPAADLAQNLYPVTWRSFIPSIWTLENYETVLWINYRPITISQPFLRHVGVSIASGLAVVACSLFFNTLAAYFFVRMKFPFKPVILIFVIMTMMIPEQVILVPMYLIARPLGLVNNFWALVVPFFASPFITFALIQFFADIPYELDEAAIMDGATHPQIVRHVIIPNAVPGLVTVSLLEFQNTWNSFYWPLIAISAAEWTPVQLELAERFAGLNGRSLAAIVLSTIPILVLFLAMQKYYYESIALTGIKG